LAAGDPVNITATATFTIGGDHIGGDDRPDAEECVMTQRGQHASAHEDRVSGRHGTQQAADEEQ
jgi:hypothetical protein